MNIAGLKTIEKEQTDLVSNSILRNQQYWILRIDRFESHCFKIDYEPTTGESPWHVTAYHSESWDCPWRCRKLCRKFVASLERCFQPINQIIG